jgi:2-polyprenyl-3-methyl-5-hydroxy-6-metoxy-1,4-benzoquinol methylase
MSEGTSHHDVYLAAAKNLSQRHSGKGTLVDVGCGSGNFWKLGRSLFDRYIGIDVVDYGGFPNDGDFVRSNLEEYSIGLPDQIGDAAVALETVEHLDNPRALFRELVRLVKPAGWIVITTPNQLSLLSKMTLVLKNQFNAFQAASYPAHRSALLEIDLVRMATESGLTEITVEYTDRGRMPLSRRHWPGFCRGRAFSDNILLVARKSHRALSCHVSQPSKDVPPSFLVQR